MNTIVNENYKDMSPNGFIFLVLSLLLHLSSGLRCVNCGSDSEHINWDCIGVSEDADNNTVYGTIPPESRPGLTFECQDEEANFCYTMVTWNSKWENNQQIWSEGVENKVRSNYVHIGHQNNN